MTIATRVTALEEYVKASKGVVLHAWNADAPRPAFRSVEWQGAVPPKNAIIGDTWVQT